MVLKPEINTKLFDNVILIDDMLYHPSSYRPIHNKLPESQLFTISYTLAPEKYFVTL